MTDPDHPVDFMVGVIEMDDTDASGQHHTRYLDYLAADESGASIPREPDL